MMLIITRLLLDSNNYSTKAQQLELLAVVKYELLFRYCSDFDFEFKHLKLYYQVRMHLEMFRHISSRSQKLSNLMHFQAEVEFLCELVNLLLYNTLAATLFPGEVLLSGKCLGSPEELVLVLLPTPIRVKFPFSPPPHYSCYDWLSSTSLFG